MSSEVVFILGFITAMVLMFFLGALLGKEQPPSFGWVITKKEFNEKTNELLILEYQAHLESLRRIEKL